MKHEWKANFACVEVKLGEYCRIVIGNKLAMEHRNGSIETARIVYESNDGHLLVEGYEYFTEFVGDVELSSLGFPHYTIVKTTEEEIEKLREKYCIPDDAIIKKKIGWFWNRREELFLQSDRYVVKTPRPYSRQYFIKDTITIEDRR